jgi:hypothetical protein
MYKISKMDGNCSVVYLLPMKIIMDRASCLVCAMEKHILRRTKRVVWAITNIKLNVAFIKKGLCFITL